MLSAIFLSMSLISEFEGINSCQISVLAFLPLTAEEVANNDPNPIQANVMATTLTHWATKWAVTWSGAKAGDNEPTNSLPDENRLSKLLPKLPKLSITFPFPPIASQIRVNPDLGFSGPRRIRFCGSGICFFIFLGLDSIAMLSWTFLAYRGFRSPCF